MKHRLLFTSSAVIMMLYGLLWLVIPTVGLVLHGHDVTTNDLASTIARFWGSAFVGLAVLLWLARLGQSDSIGVRAIVYGGFVVAVTGLFAAIMDVLYASPNAMIWLSIALYAIFSVWYGIVAFKK